MYTVRLLLCALVLAVSACVPFPHNQRESPAIRGTLVEGGAPAANIKVRLAVNPDRAEPNCPAGSMETHTDAEGKFNFPSTSYFSAFIVMGDRYDVYRLCFYNAEGLKSVWQNGAFWGGPPEVIVKCDFDVVADDKSKRCTATDVRH